MEQTEWVKSMKENLSDEGIVAICNRQFDCRMKEIGALPSLPGDGDENGGVPRLSFDRLKARGGMSEVCELYETRNKAVLHM